MTRKEEYKCTILGIYICVKNFIKCYKLYGLRKKELQILVDSCIKSFDVITTIASQDVYIISFMLTDYEYERSRLLDVYKECLDIMRFKYLLRINMRNDGKDIFIYEKN